MAKFFVATAYTEHATDVENRDVIIGKRYLMMYDIHENEYFFIDEAGDENYGCNDPVDSVYEFQILNEDERI